MRFSILFWCCTCNLWAQNPTLSFTNFSASQGLPSAEVHCIHQDRAGHMWFGTDNGVSRFDGYQFKTFGAAEGLGYNVVLNIIEDSEGRLWFGTMIGQVFYYENEEIKPYRYNHVIDEYRAQFSDGQLLQIDTLGHVYLILVGCGILKIDEQGQASLVKAQERNSLVVYCKNQDCFLTRSNCLDQTPSRIPGSDRLPKFEFFGELGRFEYASTYKGDRSHRFNIFCLGGNKVLIQSEGYQFCFENQDLLWSLPYPERFHVIKQDGLGQYWVGMANNGGMRIYKTVDHLRDNIFDQHLYNQTVTDIYHDRDGGVWIASHNDGMFYLASPKTSVINSQNGFPTDDVTAITFKSSDELIVGSSDGDVIQVNLKIQHLENLKFSGLATSNSNYIYDLHYDKDRNIIWSDEVYYENGHAASKINTKNGPHHFFSKKYHYDSDKDVLWALKGRGLNPINLRHLSMDRTTPGFTLRSRIFGLYVDDTGTVWVGGNKGLFEWDQNQLKHCNITHPAFQNRIEDIDAFDQRHLFFGTKGHGVIIWKDQQKIIEITTADGLASNMIEDVHVDENGIGWVATFNGLSKIEWDSSMTTPKVRSFTMENGLPSNEIYQIKSFEGQPWLCTAGGLVRWQDPPFDSTSYQPKISEMLVNGDLVKTPTRLKDDQNNITFNYLTINFQQFGKTPYRYRLQSEDEWTQTMSRQINYAKLSPGSYQFEVQSQNEDGIWSESTCHSFIISPPWYDSHLFYLTALLFIVTVGYFGSRVREKRSAERLRIDREIESLKKQATQAQMNPHFIFNCLNSIQGLINTKKEDEANRYLVHFSRLIRGSLHASLEKEMSLAEDIAFMRNYLELEQMRFSPKFKYHIEIDPALSIEQLTVPPMLVLPFVENAVVHGLSNANRQGDIQISYTMEDDLLVVHVTDNGVGRANSQNNGDTKRSNHKSVGISITEQRLRLSNQSNRDWVEIEDLNDKEGNICGTVVKIRLKLNPLKTSSA